MKSHRLILSGCFLLLVSAVASEVVAQAGGDAGPAGEAAAPGEAAAQGGEGQADDAARTERARVLFQQGIELSDQNRWEEAARAFQEALSLRDAPSIRFNLGASLSHLDRPAEAANQLEAVLRSAESTPELRQQAEQLLSELRGQLSQLALALEGFDGQPRVVLDGSLLNADQLSRPLWQVTGRHIATVEQDGAEVARAEFDLAAGQQQTVTLRPAPPAPPPDDGRRRRHLARDWRLWVGVGAGAVVLAVVFGLAFGLRSSPEDPIQGTMDPGVLELP